MKIYNENGKITGVVCNCCGKLILKKDNIFKDDFIAVSKQWGYFSKKDGENHSFEVCEECYDNLIESFKVPVYKEQVKEWL